MLYAIILNYCHYHFVAELTRTISYINEVATPACSLGDIFIFAACSIANASIVSLHGGHFQQR